MREPIRDKERIQHILDAIDVDIPALKPSIELLLNSL